MKVYLTILFSLILFSCTTTMQQAPAEIVTLPQTIYLPSDGSTPIAGEKISDKADNTITFSYYGDKQFVGTGQTINFVYEGINPEESFILYESIDNGYNLTLLRNDVPIDIHFSRLCQTFIVASPSIASISIDKNIRYEQIVWTPRAEGNWEVRIGSTTRGCKSEALDRLNKLRTNEYDKQAKSTIIK